MIQNIEKYLDALFSAHASVSSLEEALNTVKSNAELKEIFNDPNVTLEEKKNVCKELFAPSVNDFVAELAEHSHLRLSLERSQRPMVG